MTKILIVDDQRNMRTTLSMRLGAYDYIQKPFDALIDDLARRVPGHRLGDGAGWTSWSSLLSECA